MISRQIFFRPDITGKEGKLDPLSAVVRDTHILTSPPKQPSAPPSRLFRCTCGRPVFFRNSVCLACGTPLGFDPRTGILHALGAVKDPIWTTLDSPSRLVRRCANAASPAACNWLLDSGSSQPLCISCSLTRTVPDLSNPVNAARWGRIETAKRRLVASLLRLGLPVQGLTINFLENLPGAPHVLTGYLNGTITLNIEEADDDFRERIRVDFNEPYRTLLGHLRHEVGHFYWTRLVESGPLLESFRTVFGDERPNYGIALQHFHFNGPPPDWQGTFVSAYAAVHPHEDWAETWAHYLHMREGLDSARTMSIAVDPESITLDPFPADALLYSDDPQGPAFLADLNEWCALSTAVNELNRAMGQQDFYPFVISRAVVRKLHFIHHAVASTR